MHFAKEETQISKGCHFFGSPCARTMQPAWLHRLLACYHFPRVVFLSQVVKLTDNRRN